MPAKTAGLYKAKLKRKGRKQRRTFGDVFAKAPKRTTKSRY